MKKVSQHPQSSRIKRVAGGLLLAMGLFLGVIMAISHYLPLPPESKSAANPMQEYVVQQLPLYADFPWTTALHVIPSILLMALLGLQLIPALRRRFPTWHRYSGRVLVVAAVIITVSGLYIGIRFPFGGMAESVATVVISALFLVFIAKGVGAIRRKDVQAHRRWMLRMTATALTPISMRLMFFPIVALTDIAPRVAFAPLLLVGLTVNLVLLQLWLRRANTAAVTKIHEQQPMAQAA